jgi:hypothetical protein
MRAQHALVRAKKEFIGFADVPLAPMHRSFKPRVIRFDELASLAAALRIA